jgi:cell division protein FtsN
MSRSSVASELYKDKVEVSLDSRQIFYLFFGGSVIVGLVFVLGIVVGRRVEARAHIDRAAIPAAIDPLAALDRLAGGAGLTFQGALRGANSPSSHLESSIAQIGKQRGDVRSSSKIASHGDRNVTGSVSGGAEREDAANEKSDSKKSEKVGKADLKKADDRKSELTAEDKKVEDKKVEDKKIEDKKVEDKKVELKAEDKKAEKVEDKKVEDKKVEDKKVEDKKVEDKKIELKAEDKKAEDKKSELKAEDKKAEDKKLDDKKLETKSKFALQLSSFQSRSEAEAYLSQIKANGFGAYITEGDVSGKTYYRVRIGNYRSLNAANSAKAELEKAMKKTATVMKL